MAVNYSASGNALNPATTSLNVDAFYYDRLNRMSANSKGGQASQGFGYLPGSNDRVLSSLNASNPSFVSYWLDFHGPDGKLLAQYQIQPGNNMREMGRLLYLDGKPIGWAEDRMGSGGNWLPYGDSTTAGTPYATYFAESGGLGLWFAKQRYYNSNWGRFLTSDPYGEYAHRVRMPQSWNRYSICPGNDPVNNG